MPAVITKDWLIQEDACHNQVELFASLYPEGAPLAPGALVAAAKSGITVSWLARFLSPSALRAYRKAVASADSAYHEALASALEQHLAELIALP